VLRLWVATAKKPAVVAAQPRDLAVEQPRAAAAKRAAEAAQRRETNRRLRLADRARHH